MSIGVNKMNEAVKSTFRRRFCHMLWHSDMLATRFMLAIAALVWALLLAWPGELFTPTRTTYRIMAEIASEEAWAVAFAGQGLVMLLALLADAKDKLTWFIDCVFGAVLWTLATVACFASHWQHGVPYAPPAAMSAEVALMLASWWHLIRNPWGDSDG